MRIQRGLVFLILLLISVPSLFAISLSSVTSPNSNSYFKTSFPISIITSNDDLLSANFFLQNSTSSVSLGTDANNTPTDTQFTLNAAPSGLADGVYSLLVNLTNANGDSATPTLATNLIFDTTTPQVSYALPTPANNAVSNQNLLTITLTVQESNEASVAFVLVSPSNTTVVSTPAGTRSNTFAGLNGNAVYSYYVNVTDKSGNSALTETRQLTLDTTAPVVGVGNIPSGYLTSNFSVQATVTDLSAISQVSYRFENSSTNLAWISLTNSTSTLWNGTADFTSLKDGNYTLRFNASDTLGNTVSNVTVSNLFKDFTVPKLVDPVLSTNTSTVTINFTFPESVNGTLQYGNTSSLGTFVSTASNGASQLFSLVGLASNLSYFFNVTFCDAANNCNTSALWNFTTVASTQTQASVTPSSNIGASVTNSYDTLTAGSALTSAVNSAVIGLQSLTFNVQKNVANAQLVYNQLLKKPDSVTTPALEVYKYFEVVHDQIPDDALANIKVTFLVSKSALAQKNLGKDEVVLYHYTTDWAELPATFVEEKGDNYVYESLTPSLSVFAIVFKPKIKQVVTQANLTTDNLAQITGKTGENVLESKDAQPSSYYFVIIALSIALLAVLGIFVGHEIIKRRTNGSPAHAFHEHKHTPDEH